MRPKPRSALLTDAEEAIVVEFRRRTLPRLYNVRRSSRNDVMDASIETFRYETTTALHGRVLAFVAACPFAKHLKALRWRTPFQAICGT